MLRVYHINNSCLELASLRADEILHGNIRLRISAKYRVLLLGCIALRLANALMTIKRRF